MSLADAMFRQLRAHVANDPDSAGDANEMAEALERYNRIVQDDLRISGSNRLVGDQALQKGPDNGGTRIT